MVACIDRPVSARTTRLLTSSVGWPHSQPAFACLGWSEGNRDGPRRLTTPDRVIPTPSPPHMGVRERICSGIAAAKARGKRLGLQPGQRPKSDRLAPKVLTLLATGRSYRLIGREPGLSKNTISAIIKRSRSLISNTP